MDAEELTDQWVARVEPVDDERQAAINQVDMQEVDAARQGAPIVAIGAHHSNAFAECRRTRSAGDPVITQATTSERKRAIRERYQAWRNCDDCFEAGIARLIINDFQQSAMCFVSGHECGLA